MASIFVNNMNAKNKENILYYEYKNLESYNSESPEKREYEKKIQLFPDIIYPEYKKGRTINELANCYKLESYLIEEYILKMENKQSNNKLSTIEISDDKQNYNDSAEKITALKFTSLENKMMTLEQKLDYIISIIAK